MNNSSQRSASFQPLPGVRNPHLQTLLPRLLRRHPALKPVWQRLTMPDGDFVDLAWSEAPAQAQHKPRVVLFHGLEGSFHSPYAHGLMTACQRRGWLAVMMHFRGCSGQPNRLPRAYHAGETEDARYFLHWLNQTLGAAPTAAVGVSLGGNMLACLLSRQDAPCTLNAAAIVSAPLMLEPCSRRLEHGFSRLYQSYLLNLLRRSALRKLSAYPDCLPVSATRLRQVRRLREFDDLITARLHGFADATEYYRRSSALPQLSHIRQPLLIIQAQDDPFMTPAVIPDTSQLPANIDYQLTECGGHVGFVGGSWRKPELWLEHRIPDWFTPYLEQSA
ncbi:hydrolase [Dickeya solani]|uniref:Hydrolase n=2 Tax=Dickeya solani TaxID=1089444 RepID=A0ABU4EKG3_9GAMM|nr:hydrolase [Dickeya solani]ANE75101.1 hydrolase [Dickeya solani IPO 2222]AUC42460.1 Hydrolase, alpha/beta fold family functionally coupled to Phosphoribulokinase [Dickeya solani RNS 08.23.3.1.A]AUH09485.1 hydrolase [Dickeya solani D s0432-1]AUH13456.1 hydrolase [Dickeya solani]AYQ49634.1 putative hydrolase [Dickeya solani]